jgi:acetyltransferase-like isoleucine patch superfamily enzyme
MHLINFFFRVGIFFNIIINPLQKVIFYLKYSFNIIYSGYKSKYLSFCGLNFKTKFPLYIIGGNQIKIGDSFSSFKRNRIEVFGTILSKIYFGELIIGNNFSMNDDCHIACINKITIGDNVLIASKVFITDHFHGKIENESLNLPPYLRELYSKGEVVIGNNVWIGEGVVILPGVSIGENSIIGANSVVTKSFNNNSLIGGNPARLIRII